MSISIQKNHFEFILLFKFNFVSNNPLRKTNNNKLIKYDKVMYL